MLPTVLCLLLFVVSLSLADGDSSNVILCADGAVPKKYDEHSDGFEHLSIEPVPECSREKIEELCRTAYPNVLHSRKLNDTVEVDENGKVIEYAKFHCQDYRRAPELKVPTGAWSDRLIASVKTGCMTEGDWVELAIEEHCDGKELLQHSTGEQCDNLEDKYMDFVFVCDSPKTNESSLLEPQLGNEFDLMHQYGNISQQLKKAIEMNSADVEILRSRLRSLKERMGNITLDVDMNDSIEMEALRSDIMWNFEPCMSRNFVFEIWKQCMIHFGLQRSYKLLNLAFGLVNNDTNLEDYKNDLRSSSFEDIDCSHAPTHMFPELKPLMDEFFLNYTKRHTYGVDPVELDFLSSPNVYETIVQKYEDIFDPKLVNRPVGPPASKPITTAFVSSIVSLVLVVGVASAALYGCSRRVKQYQIDDKDILVDMEAVPDGFVTL
ncbi:hypothetical protein QR680_003826 [Steinernema hermaphroditum]|uniref:SRCR domain-containing protein n=1 Tax=Steinernema hermaphroditum TaxID=289476 RepID=A0AA39LSZ9_9BILA|nr:hypothetical protein QR680_003826 [Steinernema hermaphroditum]